MLGGLPEKRRRNLEQRLLTDEALFERVSVFENEVVYDYSIGALSAREAQHLEANFLVTPEGQRKLSFFNALKNNLGNAPEPARPSRQTVSWKRYLPGFLRQPAPFAQISAALAVLLVALGVTWLLWQTWHQRTRPPATLVVTLAPEQLRSKEGGVRERLELSGEVGFVKLQLRLRANDYESYRAEVLTDLAESRLREDGLRASAGTDGQIVVFKVPAERLDPGDYQLVLSGLTPQGNYEVVGRYYFRALRK